MDFLFKKFLNIWLWIAKPFLWWISVKINPEKLIEDLGIDLDKPILYILPKRSFFDTLVLFEICRSKKLPVPSKDITDLKLGKKAAFLCLTKKAMLFESASKASNEDLVALLSWIEQNPDQDIQILPLSILWGRNPGKEERSLFKLTFNDDEYASGLRKLFVVLAQGRYTYIHAEPSISIRNFLDENRSTSRNAIKLVRFLRLIFKRRRNSILGQKIYDLRQVISQVTSSPEVEKTIDNLHKKKKISKNKLRLQARKMVREIAADQTISIIKFFSILLNYLWNTVFDGIEVHNVEQIKQVSNLDSKDYEIVFVPNHRSHFDSLLVNYTIYYSGLPVPHTAAGINLNFWPAGWFLRRVGGFFLRRRFRGNRLYTTVFNEYLHYLVTNGYSLSFFQEGTRSRTGKLIAPKTGILSMIVHSFLRKPEKDIVFVPMHIAYDKVPELRTYLKELSGDKKRKESVFHLFRIRQIIKSYWGKAYISFGKPIFLEEFLKENEKDWQGALNKSEKPEWLNHQVNSLAAKINSNINSAAVMTPVSLISLALLSTPQRAMPEEDLLETVKSLINLQKAFPYDVNVSLPEDNFSLLLSRIDKLSSHNRFKHEAGDVIYLSELQSILMAYCKNNILHLFALPSLVARCFVNNERLSSSEIIEGCKSLYPFLSEELFLKWPEGHLENVTKNLLDKMVSINLLTFSEEQQCYIRGEIGSSGYSCISILGRILGLVFERYVTIIALLEKHAQKGFVDKQEFDQQCKKMQQRIAILNGVSNPGSAESSLTTNYVNQLIRLGYVKHGDNGRLEVTSQLSELLSKTKIILTPEMRHSIEKITTVVSE